MTIPLKILEYLDRGWQVAAELPASEVSQRAYVVVIPDTPNPRYYPEAWAKKSTDILPGELILSDTSLIQRYEIRYLQHDMKYTNTEWGWDYDYVLEDESTRINRVFVEVKEKIEPELVKALGYVPDLELSVNFDSSLVCSPITSMLDRSEDYPHLWKEFDLLDSIRTKPKKS
jgi:hypothetical protein